MANVRNALVEHTVRLVQHRVYLVRLEHIVVMVRQRVQIVGQANTVQLARHLAQRADSVLVQQQCSPRRQNAKHPLVRLVIRF